MNRKRFLLLSCAIVCCMVMKAQNGSISAMEYWLDGQIANKQPLTTTTAEIDIGNLSPGFHFISVRAQDDKGLWSSVQTRCFLIPRPTSVATSITAMEYWLDGQFANKQQLTSTMAEIDIENLSPGFHCISVRSQDDQGLWSSVQTRCFLIPRSTSVATSITAMEYWLDGQFANKQTLSGSVAEIDIENLSPGFHCISVRSQDDIGLWSSVQTRFFMVPRVEETATITHYCYWFNDETDNIVTCPYTGPVNLVEIDVSGLRRHVEHKISLVTRDSKGAYSMVMEEVFIIEPIATGISSLQDGEGQMHEEWFSLDGKKLNGRPTEQGIYIRNGKKVILK
ncbi:MAG: hypothetical protein K5893_07685 [Prevotella sp.]|nr:hypothetical protein [Prevotella sp.]